MIYRVFIEASAFVEAESEEQAQRIVSDYIENQTTGVAITVTNAQAVIK